MSVHMSISSAEAHVRHSFLLSHSLSLSRRLLNEISYIKFTHKEHNRCHRSSAYVALALQKCDALNMFKHSLLPTYMGEAYSKRYLVLVRFNNFSLCRHASTFVELENDLTSTRRYFNQRASLVYLPNAKSSGTSTHSFLVNRLWQIFESLSFIWQNAEPNLANL